ncbi:MAG: SCO family protein [Myxococcales bacterium]|nr:SCO family protein [Myxococcales bacterium]
MRRDRHIFVLVFSVCMGVGWSVRAESEQVLNADYYQPEAMNQVSVEERRGEQVPMDATFVDQDGRQVRLGDYFDGEHPVLLTLNWYECESVCTTQFMHLSESFPEVDLDGDDFRVVTISIDPSEGPELAKETQQYYLQRIGRSDLRWDFLVGEEEQIQRVAQALGYTYAVDERSGQYAHVMSLFFLSGQGMISQYLYLYPYPPEDLRFALMQAGEGKVGSVVQQFIFSCFHYENGTYKPYVWGIMRLGGALTVLILGTTLAVFWRKERRDQRSEANA